jgi:hypothetical protein
MPRIAPAVLLVITGIACLLPEPASATPANRRALSRYFGKFLSRPLDSCAACHIRADPEGAESLDDFPHNTFGDRLRVLGEEPAGDAKQSSIQHCLNQIMLDDSDGDGVNNLNELLAGHHPGRANDTPQQSTLESARARLVEFREFSSRYQWRPFEPVIRPTVPHVATSEWVRNPIDHFIAAEHATRGLSA